MAEGIAEESGAKEARAEEANLPHWDLTDFYPAPDSPELTKELERAAAAATAFKAEVEGKLSSFSGERMAGVIGQYEDIDEALSRVMSYAQLTYAGNMSDPEIARFYQSMQERVTAISAALVFFTLEINQLDEALLEELLQDSKLAVYGPWLRDLRSFKEHELSEEMERLLQEKRVSGRAAWTRLFDETMADLRFDYRGDSLTSAEVLNRLSDPEPSARYDAAVALTTTFKTNLKTFAFITNTLAKDKETEDRWRGYPRPVSSRNKANFVEDEVVEALVTSVRDAHPRLSHRYYALKAKWFGLEKLPFWDRNAPLPDEDDSAIDWNSAKTKVLSAYNAFSPTLAELGQRFFDRRWIDVPPRPGKAPGAFSHPTVPSVHPYILLNYQGRLRDVMTLAHELGHGVHQVLAAEQGHLLCQTPLTLAETASVFGEMLTFQALLAEVKDPHQKRVMLASKVEDMLNTVVRQVAMHSFETKLHDERREGELLPERICEIWMETQEDSLGPAIDLTDPKGVADPGSYWCYVPHFIHVPFYVYAYAFGDCLVNSLYAVYEGTEEGFADKYLDMLRAGGSKRHGELLAPFGLNAADPGFWRGGLSLTERFIDELEALE